MAPETAAFTNTQGIRDAAAAERFEAEAKRLDAFVENLSAEILAAGLHGVSPGTLWHPVVIAACTTSLKPWTTQDLEDLFTRGYIKPGEH